MNGAGHQEAVRAAKVAKETICLEDEQIASNQTRGESFGTRGAEEMSVTRQDTYDKVGRRKVLRQLHLQPPLQVSEPDPGLGQSL